jgi:hypothetical protein
VIQGEQIDDRQARRRAVESVIEQGAQLPNRQFRRHLRPNPTPPFNVALIEAGGRKVALMELSEDQWALLVRLTRDHMEPPQVISLPEDPALRQREASRIPELRALIDLVNA